MKIDLTQCFKDRKLVLFSGPCAIESEESSLRHAEAISELVKPYDFQFVFKSSFDKANRTSLSSYRGPGLEKGLRILERVKNEFNLPIVTDLHGVEQVAAVAEVVDVLQVPAFLCRQTDLLTACAESGKPVMIKKGQFMAPEDMKFVAEKVVSTNSSSTVMLCERGTSFGYRNLVVDFAGFDSMKKLGYPVVFDATHSLQVIGGLGGSSGGRREAASSLLRAAMAVGVNGLFMEVHEKPEVALSDGANMLSLTEMEKILPDVQKLHDLELSSRA